jgi:biotin operon repressor
MESNLNNMDNVELAYATKEVAEKLGIAKTTIRKYSQMLEDAGYEFIKNGDRRVYVNADLTALEKMKTSDKIERTAIELANKQKEKKQRKSDIESDFDKAISSVLPSNTAALELKESEKIAFMEKQYAQLLQTFKHMAVEYAATREKVDSIEENTAEILSTMNEVVKRLDEEKREKELFKEKLDLAVDFIQKSEENEKKKGFFKRLFG